MHQRLPVFRLEAHFSRWEFEARYHLCASDMQTMRLDELLALAEPQERTAWEALALGYTQVRGLPRLRDVIASTYGGLSGSDVICFAGAAEAIYAAVHATLGPDDHAVTIAPNYQSLESVPRAVCEVTAIALDPASAWELDLDRVASAIRRNTRLLCINFPHNPTGKILARASFERLIELARARGIHVLSDEVYRGLERDPARRLPPVADVYGRGLSLGVMSKAYGLPGLRIGWIASRDGAVLTRMEQIKHYLSICNAGPSELLAVIALRAQDRILAAGRALIARNVEMLDDFFARRRALFEWRAPDGGCTAFPRFLGAEGVERFAHDLITRTGILILPASIYRSELTTTPDDRFRIGFGRRDLERGLAALDRHLAPRELAASGAG